MCSLESVTLDRRCGSRGVGWGALARMKPSHNHGIGNLLHMGNTDWLDGEINGIF